jgi:hypothetical protein
LAEDGRRRSRTEDNWFSKGLIIKSFGIIFVDKIPFSLLSKSQLCALRVGAGHYSVANISPESRGHLTAGGKLGLWQSSTTSPALQHIGQNTYNLHSLVATCFFRLVSWSSSQLVNQSTNQLVNLSSSQLGRAGPVFWYSPVITCNKAFLRPDL